MIVVVITNKVITFSLAGNRNADGSTFYNRGNNTNLWSSTTGGNGAYGRNLNWNNAGVNRNSWDTSNGFSVRCIKNCI